METIASLSVNHQQYPLAFTRLPKPPDPIYVKGSTACLCRPCITIVGTRRMSAYGKIVLERFIPAFVEAGLTIVSGLAYGIDGYAHQLTLQYGGVGVAVVAGGLDRIYPSPHRVLAEQLTQKGAVLSASPPGQASFAHLFHARNHLLAILSPVTLVIEAGEKSGTLITAHAAISYGSDVCVVPGDITRKLSVGANTLLQEGALPVFSPQDVLALYGTAVEVVHTAQNKPALTGIMADLYATISNDPLTADALQQQLGLSISDVQRTLSLLELDGYVCRKEHLWHAI